MALRALRCPNCNGDINIDDSREFAYCPYCGTKILLKETIEVKHSGTVKVEGIEGIIGSATNEQIERRIAMLFDYIDGMHSCNFDETANNVLNTRDDYRVYLAYILNDPDHTNGIYYKKFYELEKGISEFEKTIQKRFTDRYIDAFLNDPERVSSLFAANLLVKNFGKDGSPLDDNTFYVVMKKNCYRTEEYLLSIGFNPLIKHSFGTHAKPSNYYRLREEDAQKYGYKAKYDSTGYITKVHPGLISFYDYANEIGDTTAVNVMQPYADKLNEEARQFMENQEAKDRVLKEQADSERKAKRKEALNNLLGAVAAFFIGIAAFIVGTGKEIASLFKVSSGNVKRTAQPVQKESAPINDVQVSQEPVNPSSEAVQNVPEKNAAAVEGSTKEDIPQQPTDSKQENAAVVKEKPAEHAATHITVGKVMDVIRWILLVPVGFICILAPALGHAPLSAIAGSVITFIECPANKKLDNKLHMTMKRKALIIVVCIILYITGAILSAN